MVDMRSCDYIIVLLTIITHEISGDHQENGKHGQNMVYNDGDVVVLKDEAVDAENLGSWNENIDHNKYIPPVSNSDIICLMNVDRYCSQPMAHVKGLLIKALKDGCENCTIKDKESVGKIIASMWTHDTESWKLFLTRFDSKHKLERIIG